MFYFDFTPSAFYAPRFAQMREKDVESAMRLLRATCYVTARLDAAQQLPFSAAAVFRA